MTVRELIKLLKECSPNDQVVLSSDAEGNSYEAVRVVADDSCFNREEGQIKLRKLTDEDKVRGYSEEDVGDETYVPCVVLWP